MQLYIYTYKNDNTYYEIMYTYKQNKYSLFIKCSMVHHLVHEC